MKPPKMKLYEFSALVCVHTVIAAESEEAARAEFAKLSENSLVDANSNADVVGVSDQDLFDVRDPRPFDADSDETLEDWLDDEAHLIVETKGTVTA